MAFMRKLLSLTAIIALSFNVLHAHASGYVLGIWNTCSYYSGDYMTRSTCVTDINEAAVQNGIAGANAGWPNNYVPAGLVSPGPYAGTFLYTTALGGTSYLFWRGSPVICPSNSTDAGNIQTSWCNCNDPYFPGPVSSDGYSYSCMTTQVPLQLSIPRAEDPPSMCKSPGVNKPIFPLRGVEREQVDLGMSISGFSVVLTYDSAGVLPRTYINNVPAGIPSNSGSTLTGTGILGTVWKSNLIRAVPLPVVSSSSTPPPIIPTAVDRGSARTVVFTSTNGGPTLPPASNADRLVSLGANFGYRYYDSQANTEETYDNNGRVTSIDWVDGRHVGYVYAAGTARNPIQISDGFGRTIAFGYSQALGQTGPNWILLTSITDPAGHAIGLTYGAGSNSQYTLSKLTWQDGQHRTYIYGAGSQAQALTGMFDELGSRHFSVGYDADGVAVSSELANGINRYSVDYGTKPRVEVTDQYDAPSGTIYRYTDWVQPQGITVTLPNGSTSAWIGGSLLYNAYLTSQSQPAGSGCGASSNGITYDANGNIASRDDFNGSRMCAVSDLSRNVEITRVEGLSNTTSCGDVTPVNAVLPTGSRKVSTAWHPDWRLEAKKAEPGKQTTSIYNGQPDPSAGNAVTSCAPNTALLPDGKPIAVLCKTIEQATTDVDGHLGFSASLQSGVPARVNSWTYNQYGQVLTAKGPRTDVNDTTTYVYYSDTTADHTMGDLQTLTNAVGQVTSYTQYNKHGQLLESTDPNGVVTVNTYDLRQRLLTTSVGGQMTTNTYDPVGQLLKVTSPDDSWIGYEYDPAHRQVAVKDSLGNRIEYVLDNAGNKTAENVKDPTGTLKRTLARSIDALGRVQQTTGRE